MKTTYFLILCSIALSFVMNYSTAYTQEAYRLPPADVVAIIDAQPEPFASISPNGEWMLFVDRDAMPTIEDVARRMLRLAGMRIDPVANSQFRTGFNRGLSIRKTAGGETFPIALPEKAKLAGVSWSHLSDNFAITTVTDQGTQLWVAAANEKPKPKQIVDNLNTVTTSYMWMPDGQSIVCNVVPDGRGDEPQAPNAPPGPNVQESSGNESPTRTYQDLLTSPFDETLFEYFAITQLQQIQLDGTARNIGKPAIYSDVAISPDGHHLLITRIKRPYSYLMTMNSFPKDIEVWNMSGELEFTVANVPLEENIPIEGVPTGPRNVDWRSVEPATLVWAEALDGGDPRVEVKHRDKLMIVAAPFKDAPTELVKIEHRSFGISDMEDPALFRTLEYDRDRRWIRSLLHNMNKQEEGPIVLMDRSMRDRYGDPGSPVSKVLPNGHAVIRQDGDWIYRSGQGASPKGNLPFLDRQNLTTLETERLWRCAEGTYESVVQILDSSVEAKPTVITVKESVELPPNYQWVNLQANENRTLTDFKDPTPQIRGIKKQLVTYERSDGVPLSATLYLPADYKPGTRLPLIVWAYPLEFNDAQTAGQISATPTRFTRMQSISHLSLLTQGYAIMDGATMPVIGDPETMNETFVEQIVDAAQAAINKAAELGVADPNRVGVGGHSYGAFMTANLLAHCDLFKAGVARSGAYNRTLTPFGFQSERRKFWDAKDVYFSISPFMHADKIKEPMLMIHGEADNNSGTFPIQSQRMYQAIKGNGGTARLVMLPYESHGYQARESVLHTQAEMIDWFDKYVKNASGPEE